MEPPMIPAEAGPCSTPPLQPTASPALPPGSLPKSESLAFLTDPLLDLCPSLHSIQSLCLLPASSLPEQDVSFRTKRLEKAILRAASNGDTELLSWICYVKSRRGEGKEKCPEAEAFQGIEWETIKDEEGTGPLNLAVSSGHAEVVQMLVQHGADVDERDALGWTPLMWATNCSNLPLVSFLLSHGADIQAKSFKGATCEDFILSCTPGTGAQRTSLSSSPGPSRLSPSPVIKPPLSPHSSDRQLISDLVFEHQQAIWTEKAQKEHNNRRRQLRSLSSSSSQESDNGATAPSSSALPAVKSANSMAQSSPSKSTHSRNSSITLRRLVGRTERTEIAEAQLRARELAEGRKRALLDVAVMMQVDYSDLIGEPPPTTDEAAKSNGIGKRRERRRAGHDERSKAVRSGLASGCGAIEVGGDPLSVEFDFDVVRPDQMLVLGETEVGPLLDRLINEARPVRAPWVARSKPANVLYMCVRYASALPDEGLLEEMLFGAVDRIEANLYAHPTEMTYLAFWLYNAMLLLHYMQRDRTLQQSDAMQDYQSLLADLINEIYVFVIRDMERRIDKVLDAALLDHDPIAGFDDVRFEGEWSFIKTLTGSVKRANQSGQGSPGPKTALGQLFSSDPTPSSSSPSTPVSKRNSGRPTIAVTPTTSMSEMREPSFDASASDLLAKPMPRTITLLLTSTLHILQLYEVNPSVIVQALSQVFFWVGCELFNRIISQRKYLCKSKAMQIRLNISALEDWVKTNALPLSIVNHHLAKVCQLVSWLLCQSSLTEFDGLIATMQGIKDLHPKQLQKVVKDYRYEVGETRIHNDCLAYLDQLQVDWEKRVEREKGERSRSGHGRSGTATQSHPDGRGQLDEEMEREEQASREDVHDDDEDEDDNVGKAGQDDTIDSTVTQTDRQQEDARRARATQRAIDRLFEPGQSMTSYVPPPSSSSSSAKGTADWSQSVLLNSRDMLPFALPSHTHTLIVSPGDAFGFGRGHFMGTGTPSLKSFRNESLLGPPTIPCSSSSSSASPYSLPGSPGMRSSASSETSSRASGVSNASSHASSRLYPQGKGLAAGAFWQPVPLLPDDTLEEIQALMRRVAMDNRLRGGHGGGTGSRRPSLDARLSEAAVNSPAISTALLEKSPFFDPSRPSSQALHLSPNPSLSPQPHSPYRTVQT